jgi:hypothetical protein
VIVGVLFVLLARFSHAAPNPQAGPVTGVIDGIDYAGDHYYVHGWAC